MSLWSRFTNVVRGDRLSREIHEELESHIEEAMEQGRDPAEARKAFGSALRYREESRDVRLITWLASLRADIVFGWRQLRKNKVTSSAAILSLALAIGACISAFRLIDALLLRPLPVSEPDRLYVVSFEGRNAQGRLNIATSCSYPLFLHMQAAVPDQAELLAISYARRVDLTYGSDQQMEKAYLQNVSGSMFRSFGLRPVVGRLLTDNDDLRPGAHPYAVLSHDYWTGRFAQDPDVIGRTFRRGANLYEIVGVAEEGFLGTETGIATDIFVPMMMRGAGALSSQGSFWLRVFARLHPGVVANQVGERLHTAYLPYEEDRRRGYAVQFGTPYRAPDQKGSLAPAAAGVSQMQREYRRSLTVLGVLVALVLLIACANVANLMTAQAAARAREMALRVSIGAGRSRLVRLVLLEGASLAFVAAGLAGLFAWWCSPFVIRMLNSPDDPARLALPIDWRVLGFGLALALSVTIMSGLAPALRASATEPVGALKGGADPHSRCRLMHALVGAQVAFCFVVLFVAGLFVTTLGRLSNVTKGYSAKGVLTLETIADPAQPAVFWDQLAEHLGATPGVEAVSLARWPLLKGENTNSLVWINGLLAGERLTYFLFVSPGWVDTMKVPFLNGTKFRAGGASLDTAIVNETFAKEYFGGESPIGKSFETLGNGGSRRRRFEIVGVVGDIRHRRLRDPSLPTALISFYSADADGAAQPRSRGTFLVRTSGTDPLAVASVLRQEVSQARSEFRVSSIRTQQEIDDAQTIRERLLAMLGLFFAIVALLLAAVGLYGVLHYSVVQRRREIGIRMALGARAGDVARRVSSDISLMVLMGTLVGLALGMASVRYIETLLYGVKATDLTMLAVPSLTLLAAALLAALPAVMHAVRIDPARTLRSE